MDWVGPVQLKKLSCKQTQKGKWGQVLHCASQQKFRLNFCLLHHMIFSIPFCNYSMDDNCKEF